MDGNGAFYVIHRCLPGWRTAVDFRPSAYNRVPHASTEVESSITTRWETTLRANPKLFNGSKFRYAGCAINLSLKSATLHLGLTDYCAFQGTHGVVDPLVTFGLPGLARPIGNAIVVSTSDDLIALLRRAGSVGEGASKGVFPGGHPEPEMVSKLIEGGGERVRQELWNGARREVAEELFIEDDVIEPLRCLGLVARERDAKVCQIFAAQLRISSEQVREFYQRGNVAQEESVDIVFVEKQRVRELACGEVVKGLRFMPEHRGAAQLWVETGSDGELL